MSKIKWQNLAVCYEVSDHRVGNKIWIVDYFPLIPIKNRIGKEKVNVRVKEQWGSGEDGKRAALDRVVEVNNILTQVKAAPKLQTWLSQGQVDMCEQVVLHKMKQQKWTDLDGIFEFALKNGYAPPIDAPFVPEAYRQFLFAVRNGEDPGMVGNGGQKILSQHSYRNYKDIYRFVCVVFANYKPAEISIAGCYAVANGEDTLSYVDSFDSELRPNGEVVESEGERPWKVAMKRGFLRTMSAFLNYCAKRGWRSRIQIPLPMPSVAYVNQRKLVLCAFRIAEAQAYLDAGWIYMGGFYAAFVTHAMFGGSRVNETCGTSADALDLDILGIDGGVAKTGKGRDSIAIDNFIIMIQALKKKKLYNDENLRCPILDQMAIRALAGFLLTTRGVICKVNSAHKRGEYVLDENGKPYNFGVFPPNAARRTAIAMHFQLYRSIKRTVAWAGNSDKIFRDWYVRLCSPEDARLYWTMLPTELINLGIVAPLPKNHVLDRKLQDATTIAIQNG